MKTTPEIEASKKLDFAHNTRFKNITDYEFKVAEAKLINSLTNDQTRDMFKSTFLTDQKIQSITEKAMVIIRDANMFTRLASKKSEMLLPGESFKNLYFVVGNDTW